MSKVAFLTYNALGSNGDVENGWHTRGNHSALVLQGTPTDWGHLRLIAFVLDDADAARKVEQSLSGAIDSLWDALLKAAPELDQVFIYVGIGGTERAIELAVQLPPGKVTFVYCDCQLRRKMELMAKVPGSRRVQSLCGGGSEMLALFKRFLADGSYTPV